MKGTRARNYRAGRVITMFLVAALGLACLMTGAAAAGSPYVPPRARAKEPVQKPAPLPPYHKAPAHITSISPNTMMGGMPSFTLKVFGTFNTTSQIQWNGSSIATYYDSDQQIRATIDANRLKNAGTVQVTVENFDAEESNAVPSMTWIPSSRGYESL